MRKIILLLMLCLPLLLTANFIGMNHGARAMAMGNAYIALADEPTAIYYNPAGLAKINAFSLTVSHENLYGISDLYNNMLAFIAPLPYTRVGLGVTQLALWDEYSEQIFYLSAASILRPMGVPFYFGASFKYERVNVLNYAGSENPANFDLNIGFIVEPSEDLSLGFTADNILQPEFKIVSANDKLFTEYTAGVCYNWRDAVNFTADYEWNKKNSHWNFGGEIWFYKVFAARLGYAEEKLTTGFGLKAEHWTIDGALLSHSSLGSTYRISVGLNFGGKK